MISGNLNLWRKNFKIFEKLCNIIVFEDLLFPRQIVSKYLLRKFVW